VLNFSREELLLLDSAMYYHHQARIAYATDITLANARTSAGEPYTKEQVDEAFRLADKTKEMLLSIREERKAFENANQLKLKLKYLKGSNVWLVTQRRLLVKRYYDWVAISSHKVKAEAERIIEASNKKR